VKHQAWDCRSEGDGANIEKHYYLLEINFGRYRSMALRCDSDEGMVVAAWASK